MSVNNPNASAQALQELVEFLSQFLLNQRRDFEIKKILL